MKIYLKNFGRSRTDGITMKIAGPGVGMRTGDDRLRSFFDYYTISPGAVGAPAGDFVRIFVAQDAVRGQIINLQMETGDSYGNKWKQKLGFMVP